MSNIASYDQPQGLQIGRLFGFVFDSPKWFMNLLCTGVCVILNQVVIGQLVFLGYQYEIIESLHRNPRQAYPDFEVNRVVDYLIRGVWPFLASLAVTFVILLVAAVIIIPALIIGAVTSDNGEPNVVTTIIILLAAFLVSFVAIVFSLFMTPIMLRSGLTGNFAEGFNVPWVKDFVRRTWGQMLIGYLCIMVAAIPLTLIGLLMCLVGAFFTNAWLMLAIANFQSQLYELYLARGGEPIPLPETVVANVVY